MGLKILGTGSCLPAQIITNDDLSLILDTNDEWIRTRTGIVTRHILGDGESLVQLGASAVENALDMAGTDKSEIGLLICCTLGGDWISPSGAAMIQERAGLPERCVTFDLNMGCCGFVYGLQAASAYLEAGICRKAVVVSAEALSRHADWTDRATCCLFGDGAGAVVLEKSDAPTPFCVKVNGDARFLGIHRGEDNCPYHTPGEAHKLFMNGQVIYKFAVSAIEKCIGELTEGAGITADDVDRVFLHQANMRIIDSSIRQMKQSAEKFPHNIERCGNTSSASIPILLDEENRKGNLSRGQRVILCAFGAGLASAGCLIEW
jgi:3-oxoacyl-[acyl-carrier-protein] synthase-3